MREETPGDYGLGLGGGLLVSTGVLTPTGWTIALKVYVVESRIVV
ncbi:MAG: hypothetical protein ACH36H_11085 [Candidatus Nanopelagicales bacterium]